MSYPVKDKAIQNKGTKNRGAYPQKILVRDKDARKRIEANAERYIKNLAIYVLPKGHVHPNDSKTVTGQSSVGVLPFAFGAEFEFDESGNEIVPGEIPSYTSLQGKSYNVQIGGVYFGFILTYYDPTYFKHFPHQKAGADGGLVFEKGNKAYVLDTTSFFQIVLPMVSRAAEAFNTYVVPRAKPGLLSELVYQGAIHQFESLLLGIERTLEGLNIIDDNRVRDIAVENERMLRLIIKLIKAADEILMVFASLLVSYTVYVYFHNLPPKIKKEFKELLVKQGAKMGGKKMADKLIKILAKKIVKKIVRTATYRSFAKFLKVKATSGARGATVVFSLLKAQGVLQRASDARHRLKRTNPFLYKSLVLYDLDMAYFLVEDHMPSIQDMVNNYLEKILSSKITTPAGTRDPRSENILRGNSKK